MGRKLTKKLKQFNHKKIYKYIELQLIFKYYCNRFVYT